MGTACHVVITHGRGSVGREAWSLRCHGQFRDEAMAHAPPAGLQCRSECDVLPACSQLELAGIVCFCNATLRYS